VRLNALIDEGLSILSRLDADGKLTDDQKAWRESFVALRNRAQ
jgi:hypothetical protein